MVHLTGLRGKFGAVPLREVYWKSDSVNGPVTVCVVSSLPVEGISMLGNDLAANQVKVNPVVSSEPCDEVGLVELEVEVFPACLVTRAQEHAVAEVPPRTAVEPPVGLTDAFLASPKEGHDPLLSYVALVEVDLRPAPPCRDEELVDEVVGSRGSFLAGDEAVAIT